MDWFSESTILGHRLLIVVVLAERLMVLGVPEQGHITLVWPLVIYDRRRR
jgi:hypothetical protein